MMEELTPFELLDKAADVMQVKGWNSGSRHHPNGTVCVLGALEDAMGIGCYPSYRYISDDTDPILGILAREIGLTVYKTGNASASALATWSNNLDGPTVIGWLRKIAGRLRDAVTI